MAGLAIPELHGAAKNLWVLGSDHGKDKQIIDAPELLKRLNFPATTFTALVRSGLVVETGESDVYILSERVYRMRRLIPRGKEFERIKVSATAYLNRNPYDDLNLARSKVALLIDWDNFVTQLEKYDLSYSSRVVIEKVRALGDLVLSMVFTDVARLDYQTRTDLYVSGYEVIDCPKLGIDHISAKDTADAALYARIFWLIQYCPAITTVAIATEDRDFLRCVSLLKSHNKKVVVINAGLNDGSLLHRQADKVITVIKSTGQEIKLITHDFINGVYDLSDPELRGFMEQMKLVVRALAEELPTDRDSMTYTDMKNYLVGRQDLSADQTPPAIIDCIIQFFIQRGVLTRLNGPGNGSSKMKLNPNHSFVTWCMR